MDMESMGPPAMLSGLRDTGASMFEHLMPDMTPDPETLEKEAQKAQFGKSAKLKGFYVKTYDLAADKEAKAYAKIMLEMFHGLQGQTHVILFNERKFVETDSKPRWIAHIEWAEFELDVKAYPTTAGAPPA